LIKAIALTATLLPPLSPLAAIDPDAVESSTGITETKENPWGDGDLELRFPELDALETVGMDYSLKSLEEAKKLYKEAVTVLNGTDAAIEEKLIEADFKEAKTEWKRREIERNQERIARNIHRTNSKKALELLVHAMDAMNRIQNPDVVASSPYKQLQSNIYRQYIKLQFQGGNLIQCISMIEKYFQVLKANEQEPEPHRILVICYDRLSGTAKDAKDYRMAEHYLTLKNHHLLRYAELHYGKNSNEYRTIKRDLTVPFSTEGVPGRL